MNRNSFIEYLSAVNHSRENRQHAATMVLDNPSLIPMLLEIAFQVDEDISCRACWVLEFTSKKNIEWLLPHIDTFLDNAGRVHLDPAVRPVAKICEYLTEAYFGKKPSKVKSALTNSHLERITELCFDWLINDEKVAAKAYSMRSLFLLGTKFDWIHPELKLILEENYAQGSAAYKARARHTFEALRKFRIQQLRSAARK